MSTHLGIKFDRLPLPQKEIEKCYLEKKISIHKIAKKYNCSEDTIRNRLKKSGIALRTLRESKNIAKPYYKRVSFNGSLEEKAYMIGFRLGDLFISQTSQFSPTIRISTNTTMAEQIELFTNLFKKYGHINISKPDYRGAVLMRCYVDLSFNFMLDKDKTVKEWIINDKQTMNSFCAGYFDAEGTICLVRNDAVASLRSQDKEIIISFYKHLRKLGILCRPPILSRKAGVKDVNGVNCHNDVWHLAIYRKEALLKFFDIIGKKLIHPKKLVDMKIAKENIINRNIRYNNRKDNRFNYLYEQE